MTCDICFLVGLTGVDWPLVLSCLSVVVLFFIVLVGVGVAVQRKGNVTPVNLYSVPRTVCALLSTGSGLP